MKCPIREPETIEERVQERLINALDRDEEGNYVKGHGEPTIIRMGEIFFDSMPDSALRYSREVYESWRPLERGIEVFKWMARLMILEHDKWAEDYV